MVNDGKLRHYIVFDGVSTFDYACYCDGSETFGAPEREYESVQVPGRNGELKLDKGRYKDQTLKYTMFFEKISEFEDYKNKMAAKTGIRRLDDSHHTGEYRLAALSGDWSPKVAGYNNEYCSIELSFTAKPQRFLTSGEAEKTFTNSSGSGSSNIIFNPTQFFSKPLVKVTGSGTVDIGSAAYGNSIIRVLDEATFPLYIDCELQDAYYISGNSMVSANDKITLLTGDFFTLAPGRNYIVFQTGTLSIIPRWWKV